MRAARCVFVGIVAVAIIPAIQAEASCPDPVDLCPSPTGSCFFSEDVTVTTPCVIDVRPRKLIVSRKVRVVGGGTFSISGSDVDVSSGVFGGHIDASGDVGAHVVLTATNGIGVSGPIDVSGASTAGSLELTAGGAVYSSEYGAAIKADGGSGGGTVTATAGGSVVLYEVSAQSSDGPGGTITLLGGTGAGLGSANITGSKLATGGAVYVSSISGYVSFGTIRSGNGATITIRADNGRVDMGDASRIKMKGDFPGPILIESAAQNVRLRGNINAKGLHTGGSITVRAATEAFIQGKIRAVGKEMGGSIVVEASTVTLERPLKLDASSRLVGGEVRVLADLIDASTGPKIAARGGGRIRMTAANGALSLSGILLTKGGLASGLIDASAATDLVTDARFIAGPGGCIALAAGGMLDISNARFDNPVQADCPGSPSGAFL